MADSPLPSASEIPSKPSREKSNISPPQQRSRIKQEVCAEVIAKLKESEHEALDEPGLIEEIQNHFNRLPTRYALDVNTERADDVIIHKKLLQMAKDKDKPPFFYVRPVHILPAAELAALANSSENPPQQNDSGFLTSVNRGLMRTSIHPPAFGSSTNLEALGLESTPKPMAIDEDGKETDQSIVKNQYPHIPLHEITFATVDRPKLLSQLSAVLADSGLNIREAHVFSTTDGFSLDCFLVDGWDSEEVDAIQDAISSHLNSMENAAWTKPIIPSPNLPPSALPEPVPTASEPSSHVKIPTDGVDDWEIDSKHLKLSHKVASGSFGDLFRGTYCGQDVAIKILKPERLNDTLQQEFAQEVFIMRKVRHKNVVQFIGACTKPPNLSIVTEFMSGGSVYDYLHKQKGTMKLTTLLKIACDVAKGMDFLHKNNIIHRDLKAANLLMDENEVVKIADFGVARIQAQSGVMTAETGTYRWMAPEVIEHRPYDNKADVFSFGIVLWELLTGKLPYNDLTPLQAAVSVVQRGLRPTIPPKTHPSVVSIMERCWKSNPSERPEFCEIVKILQKTLKEVEEESNPDLKSAEAMKKSGFFSSLRRTPSSSKQ